jgi:hypothetical protein
MRLSSERTGKAWRGLLVRNRREKQRLPIRERSGTYPKLVSLNVLGDADGLWLH